MEWTGVWWQWLLAIGFGWWCLRLLLLVVIKTFGIQIEEGDDGTAP